nr:hypothetical protein Iba_scaffold43282CG0010 [Ipomoea batatas]GME04434.1 hypothetical protein Iba_scaffold1927CG0010 [Ipomoea batatas]GME06577.1 hypothetical protein Iba_scaffold4385CG0010 [Ipomoea batatas]
MERRWSARSQPLLFWRDRRQKECKRDGVRIALTVHPPPFGDSGGAQRYISLRSLSSGAKRRTAKAGLHSPFNSSS